MKKLVAMFLIVSMLMPTTMVKASNEPSDWAKSSVDKVMELGLNAEETVTEYTEATSREEFAALVVVLAEKALGEELEAPVEKPFTDSDDEFVEKAYQAGIVQGVGGGLFEPKENVTREQIVVMYMNAMMMLEEELERELIDEELSWAFDDEEEFSSWAEESIRIAGANGLVKGVGNNTFDPKGFATKEQSLVLSLRSFYFTEDIDGIFEKSYDYYEEVNSMIFNSEIQLNMSIEEQGVPMLMDMVMNVYSEHIYEPMKMKMITDGDVSMEVLGQEILIPLDAEQYMIQEDDELIFYFVADDPATGEKIYEKMVMPFELQELDTFAQMDKITDFDSFGQYRLVDQEIVEGKTIDKIALTIDMDKESMELLEGIIGDSWGEIGLDSSSLSMLNGFELIYGIDSETGEIIYLEADLGDYLNTVLSQMADAGELSEVFQDQNIEVNKLFVKVEYVSVNELEDIVVPQEVIDNAVDITELLDEEIIEEPIEEPVEETAE